MSTIPGIRPTRERTPAPIQRPNEIGVTTTRIDGIPKVRGEFEYGVGSQEPGAGVAEVLGRPVVVDL